MVSMYKWILGKVAHKHAKWMRQRFRNLTQRPTEVQRKHLFDQIRREQDTGFGRDHHFRSIKSVEDFRRHLPITNYEYYQPYIERVKNGDTEAMFHRQKVLMFAMSSGTTDARKFIPVTQRYLDDYRRGWTIWGLHLFETHKHLWFKTMIQIASDWDEFRTPAGIPCGSISGMTAQVQKLIVRKTYCLPPVSSKIRDVQAKYYLAWRLGLMRDVGIMVSANPSTIVSFARFGGENYEKLIRDIHDGTIHQDFPVPKEIYQVEHKRLRAKPERARALEEIVNKTGGFRPKDVWPFFGAIGNWTGGSVGAYMRHFPEFYGSPSIRDIGLVASEGRMTIPIENNTSGGILEITSSFFEFVPVDEIHSPQPTVLESHELQEGRDYYILLTTSSGLYRYNIFDVVRCVGWFEKTPLLAFLNKGSNFSNITGEKVSEYQVAKSVENALVELDHRLTAFTLAPCWDDRHPYYGLFVEEGDFADLGQAEDLVRVVEQQLRRMNSEYHEKRASGRLGAIRLQLLPTGAWRKWDRARLQRTGGTSEQYKHPCLIPDLAFQSQMPVLDPVTPVARGERIITST
ncbi:MAG: GH3 auxin-responsive promoter family protein [Planctomycetota bacterium]